MKFLKIERLVMAVILFIIAFGVYSIVISEVGKTDEMRILKGEFDTQCGYERITNAVLDSLNRDNANLGEYRTYIVYDMDQIVGHIRFEYAVANNNAVPGSETVTCLP